MNLDSRTVIASMSDYRREALRRQRRNAHLMVVRCWLQGMGLAFLMAFACVGLGGLVGSVVRWWAR